MTNLPIACTLSADDLRTRRESLIPGLVQRATRIAPIDGGYELHFAAAPDLFSALAQTIEAERQCCQFLRFELIIEPNQGPITLSITGFAGTQQFLNDLLTPAR